MADDRANIGQVDALASFFLKLERQISEEDHKQMLIFGRPVLGKRTCEDRCKTPTSFFEALTEVGKISRNNVDFLTNIFKETDRTDLVKIVEEFKKQMSDQSDRERPIGAGKSLHTQTTVTEYDIQALRLRLQQKEENESQRRNVLSQCTILQCDTSIRQDQECPTVADKLPLTHSLLVDVASTPAGKDHRTGKLPTDTDAKDTHPKYAVRSLDGKGDDKVGPFDAPFGVWFAQNNSLIAVNTGSKKSIDTINPDFSHKQSIVPVSPLMKAFSPWDVAMCNDRFLFSDTANRCVVVWDENEGYMPPLGVDDDIDPRGITIYQEYVVVTDVKNHEVLKYNQNGRLVKKAGGKGKADGKFFFPASVTVDSKRRLLVSDKYNNRVQVFDFDNLLFVTLFGTASSGNGQLSSPQGISVDINDNVYVCDTDNRRIVKYDSGGNWLYNIGATELEAPSSIAVRQSGNICIAVVEFSKNRIRIFSEVKETK